MSEASINWELLEKAIRSSDVEQASPHTSPPRAHFADQLPAEDAPSETPQSPSLGRRRNTVGSTLRNMLTRRGRDQAAAEEQAAQQPSLTSPPRRMSAGPSSADVLPAPSSPVPRRLSSGASQLADNVAAAGLTGGRERRSGSSAGTEGMAGVAADKFSTVSRSLLARIALQSEAMRHEVASPRLTVAERGGGGGDGAEEGVTVAGLVEMALKGGGGWAWTLLLTHRLFVSSAGLVAMLRGKWEEGQHAAVLSLVATWLQRLSLHAAGQAGAELAALLRLMSAGGGDHGCAAASARLLREFETAAVPPSPAVDEKSVASLEAIDAEEFAAQLTLLSHRVFRRIPPHELLSQRWTGADKFMLAPNVMAAANNSNVLCQWMVTRVVEVRETRQRVAVLAKLVAAGTVLAQLCNYNGVMQIVSALTNSAVARLKNSFAALPRGCREQLETLRQLVESQHNFRLLRAAQEEAIGAGGPCMPYLALWLTDLVMLDEAGSPLTAGGLLNGAHLRSVARVLEQVVAAQRVRYGIAASPAVADFIVKGSSVCTDEAALFQMSLLCEPRL